MPAPDTTPAKAKPRVTPATIALGVAAVLALGAVIISMRGGGETQPANTAAAPAAPAEPSIEEQVAALQQQLRADPDNAALWSDLGKLLRVARAGPESERAFRRAMELEPRNAEYITFLAEAVLLNRQGQEGVLDEADALLKRAAAVDPRHPMTRFYLATVKDQRGQHREAIDDLIALLRDAPPGAEWAGNVRRSIENVAQLRRIDIAGRLPAEPPPSAATAAIPGPTREQMDAARGLTPTQQDEMVKGMVDRLAARLQQNPRDERGWMMLMRSRIVQGDQGAAAASLRSALAAFADDAAVQQRLRAAAAELGIPQA